MTSLNSKRKFNIYIVIIGIILGLVLPYFCGQSYLQDSLLSLNTSGFQGIFRNILINNLISFLIVFIFGLNIGAYVFLSIFWLYKGLEVGATFSILTMCAFEQTNWLIFILIFQVILYFPILYMQTNNVLNLKSNDFGSKSYRLLEFLTVSLVLFLLLLLFCVVEAIVVVKIF